MTKCLQIMCAKYYKIMYMFKKKCTQKTAPCQSWRICLIQHQHSRFFQDTAYKSLHVRQPGSWSAVQSLAMCPSLLQL